MPAITFPSSPVTNQVFASGNSAWQWDGSAWRVIRNSNFYAQLGFDKINFFGATLTDAQFTGGTLASNVAYQTVTQTLTNKQIGTRNSWVTSASSITPNAQAIDQFNVTALAATLTINQPTGVAFNGQRLMFRIKDNGTTRTLNWDSALGGYRALGVALPTATSPNKTTYVGFIFNLDDDYWDAVALAIQA